MCGGPEVATAATAAETAKGAAELTAALAPYEVAAGASTAAGAGAALVDGASFAQPANAFGTLPDASFTQSVLAQPGGASSFAGSALTGGAAGAGAAALLDAGSYGYGGPEPGLWDTAKGALDTANGLYQAAGPVGRFAINQVGSAALQGIMGGDSGNGTQRPSTSFGGAQAVPLREPGLYGSTGVAGSPAGTLAASSLAPSAPVSSSALGGQSAPSSPVATSPQGAVRLRNPQQYA